MCKKLLTPLDALKKAVKIAGGQAKLAKMIDCKNTTQVSVMVNRDKKASVTYVAKISQVTGVPCHELRPDIFPAPNPANDSTNQQDIA